MVCLFAAPNLKFSSQKLGEQFSFTAVQTILLVNLTSLLVVVCELLCRIVQTPTEMFPNSCLDMYMASSVRSS